MSKRRSRKGFLLDPAAFGREGLSATWRWRPRARPVGRVLRVERTRLGRARTCGTTAQNTTETLGNGIFLCLNFFIYYVIRKTIIFSIWESYKSKTFKVSDGDARLRDPNNLTTYLKDAASDFLRIPKNETVEVADVKVSPTGSTKKGVYALAMRPTGVQWGWTSVNNFAKRFANVTIGLVAPTPGAGKFSTTAVWKGGAYQGQAELAQIVDVTGEIEKITLDLAREFLKMVDAAADDGVAVVMNSGFRTYAEQKFLYDQYKKGVPGYNLAAPPGSSNHQTGIAIDIAVGGAAAGPIYDWLADHATSFGFIRTVKSEPWHWEYRPTAAAAAKAAGNHKSW